MVGFGLLSAFFPAARIDRILREAGRLQRRPCLLPSKLVVYYVLALASYAEPTLARPLLERLAPDMLCLCDRAYFGFEAWEAARATGAALLWRLKKNASIAVEERLADGSYLSRVFPNPNVRRKGEHPGVTVRIIEYGLDDPGRPGGGATYCLATTLLDPEAAPAGERAARCTRSVGRSRSAFARSRFPRAEPAWCCVVARPKVSSRNSTGSPACTTPSAG